MKKFFCIIIIFSFIILFFNKSFTNLENKQRTLSTIKNQNNTLSMMIEQTAGVGDYKMETRSSWPTDGYKFNATLSKCENGGELGWNSEKGVITMTGNKSDKCYIYFDIYNKVVLNNVNTSVTNNSITLTALATDGTNSVSKYYFSKDNGNSYFESSTNSYTFTELSPGMTFNIKVYVLDTFGYKSNVISLTLQTTNLITFTIAGTSYNAESGMTWAEWVNSSYSENSFGLLSCMADNDTVYKKSSYDIVTLYSSNKIVENHSYSLGEMPDCN